MAEIASVSIKWGAPGGVVVGVVIAVALVVVGLWSLRQAWSLPRRGRRLTLVGLRVATLLLALPLSLQPQWVTERVQNVEGRLAVLLDVSRSMLIRDADQSRAARAAAIVRDFAQQSDVPFDLYAFGQELRPLPLDELPPEGLARDDDTRIERALEQVAEQQGGELGAVLLLSDGADMAPGWEPVQAKRLGVRVHTLALSSDRTLSDEGIVKVKADPVSFLRQSAEVEVTVRSTRKSGEPLVVTLRHEGEVVAEASAEIGEDGQGRVVLPFTPARLGRSVYTLSLPLSAEDAVPENNERAFLVRVTRDKLRVLLVCGAPSWDTRFLRAFLKSDPAIDLITFFILRTSNDLTMAPPEELSLIPFPTDELFREHLDSFDLVIFQDFNYGPYQMAQYLPRLRDYVLAGGAFAMVGGTKSFGPGGYLHTPIAEILPVEIPPGEQIVDGPFSPRIEEETRHHPIVELVPDVTRNVETWRELAPLIGANRLGALRGDAVALLSHPSASTPGGKPMPVLAVGAAGKGRTMALGVDSSFRWGITTAGQRGDASAYERFWDRALRWLSRDPWLDPARVETDRERYGPGARVRASALLRDFRYVPRGSQSLEASVVDRQGQVKQVRQFVTDGAGRAQVELDAPLEPGGYRVVVRDPENGEALCDEGFVVETGGDELGDPRARPEELAELSAATSGQAYREGSVPRLSQLDRTRARGLGSAVHAPFATPWFFVLLSLVFAAEWGLRRAWGLR